MHAILNEKYEHERLASKEAEKIVGELQDVSLKNVNDMSTRIIPFTSDELCGVSARSETPSPDTREA